MLTPMQCAFLATLARDFSPGKNNYTQDEVRRLLRLFFYCGAWATLRAATTLREEGIDTFLAEVRSVVDEAEEPIPLG